MGDEELSMLDMIIKDNYGEESGVVDWMNNSDPRHPVVLIHNASELAQIQVVSEAQAILHLN